MNATNPTSINDQTAQLFRASLADCASMQCLSKEIAGASILDAGVETPGSLEAGLLLARLCLAGRADVQLTPVDDTVYSSSTAVYLRTDSPLVACLGAQYAGWPVQTDDFFAMGSGPMRMARGREAALEKLSLVESPDSVVGVLESDKLVSPSAVESIASQCGVDATTVHLAIAPSTCIAGSVQVVARSVETAMHKLHELGFDVRCIVSGTGLAPVPPPAKPGDTVGGIGRTNDAMLYGATVTLWVDCDDAAIEQVADQIPSRTSRDYGRPFAKTFKDYKYDFYKVDPMLFSPAKVVIHNLRTGRTWRQGQLNPEVLATSFLGA